MRRFWTPDEDATLARLYPETTNDEIAQRLGRSSDSIMTRAAERGLRKSPEFMRDHRFRAGRRQGVSAQIYMPVGSLRIRKHGTLERKIHEGLPWHTRWRAVHLLVWEVANGPIPAGHVVVFKEGRRTNAESEITLGRLELISRAEYSRRNSYHNRYPAEVAEVIQLRAQLNRKLNRRGTYAQQAQ